MRHLPTFALCLLPFAFCLRASAQQLDEPFCEQGLIRILHPQPRDEFDHWLPEENPDGGFLSSTVIRCEAQVADGIDPASVRWHIRQIADCGLRIADWEKPGSRNPEAMSDAFEAATDKSGIRNPQSAIATGQGLRFTFVPGGAPLRRRTEPLVYEISATVRNPATGQVAHDTVTICQDEIDQIRQEYIDFPRRSVERVPRQAFLDQSAFEQAWRDALTWKGLNKTRSRAGEPYRYVLVDPALVEGLQRWRQLLGGRELIITSGYRNPYKQAITSRRGNGAEAAPAGMHQYGKAVDVQANVTRNFRDWLTVAWTAIDAGADYVETIPEGSWHHVHADWRLGGQGPAETVKLRITGRVTDATGTPLPGVTILGVSDSVSRFPGMPAWQSPDAEGRFELRAVWHPGRKYYLRAQVGRRRQTLAFTVPESGTPLVEREVNFVFGSGAPAQAATAQGVGRRTRVTQAPPRERPRGSGRGARGRVWRGRWLQRA